MLNKPLHAILQDIVKDVYASIKFIYRRCRERLRNGNYYFPYRTDNLGHSVFIFANGPSLNTELEGLMINNSTLENVLVVNFFVESDIFVQIKPRYYCLADPVFNIKECLTERTRNTYSVLNELVSWPMTIFVWKEAEDMVTEFIDNSLIKIVGLSILTFEGFEFNRYKYYKKGIAVPSYVNVTIMGLYAMLNLGYSTIYMYGVDHSFLAGLGVNNENRLCIKDVHFYGTKTVEVPPRPDGTLWHVKDFIYDKYLTFVEHEIMRGYADYLGAQVINCTKESWIDAYVRKVQLERQLE